MKTFVVRQFQEVRGSFEKCISKLKLGPTPARMPCDITRTSSLVASTSGVFCQSNCTFSFAQVGEIMAAPASEYKDRQFIAVIGDEVWRHAHHELYISNRIYAYSGLCDRTAPCWRWCTSITHAISFKSSQLPSMSIRRQTRRRTSSSSTRKLIMQLSKPLSTVSQMRGKT